MNMESTTIEQHLDNLKITFDELSDLGINNPTIIAFGRDAHTVLNRNFKTEYEIFSKSEISFHALDL